LADKKDNQKNVSNWNLVTEPDLLYCRFAMNCPADQIGRTTTSTDSQNLPPDLFSKDCTFSSNQRLLDPSWRSYTVMKRSHVSSEDKNYGVGIFAAI
jgi:hypothetical protein